MKKLSVRRKCEVFALVFAAIGALGSFVLFVTY